MATTVKQSAVDSLGLIGPILPMAPTTAINELATQIKNVLDQHAQDIGGNDQDIALLQQQVSALLNLQEAERQKVLNIVNQELQNLNIETEFVVSYRGEIIEVQTFLQMLADQQTKKPVEVSEVTKTDGRVTSAKIVFDDNSTEQTISFARSEADSVATYIGQISDGAGGLIDGYEFKLEIQSCDVAGLNLSSYWDGDLLSQKLFVSNLSIRFTAVSPQQQGGDEAPDTL
ncbi:MAG: hypothetical protein AAGA83_21585 [Cyanobacteria bacterium P01_F01_bin.116]